MKKSFEIKIVILICYYGDRLPWYFSYFLHSCSFNSSIDFIFITDIPLVVSLPDNVKIHPMPMVELKTLASEKLGIQASLEFPYKLCDYKPAYGLIFSELVKSYDFWGHSDVDIIYGNIRRFANEKFLNSYDYISLRHDYTTGCFALYRNTPQVNTAFQKSKDYKLVYETRQHFCFDECNFVQDALTAGESIYNINTSIESFTHIMKSAEKREGLRVHFDFILMEGLPGKISFQNGTIIYAHKWEVILYHLFWLKQVYKPKNLPRKVPNSYRISHSRIYS